MMFYSVNIASLINTLIFNPQSMEIVMSIDLNNTYDEPTLVVNNPVETAPTAVDNTTTDDSGEEFLLIGNLSDKVYTELNRLFALENVSFRRNRLMHDIASSNRDIVPDYVFVSDEEALSNLDNLIDSFNVLVTANNSGKLRAVYIDTVNATSGVSTIANFATDNNIPIHYSKESLLAGIKK
jgi:uncharacterized secreted protein with C-terminal beta-propeller domain